MPQDPPASSGGGPIYGDGDAFTLKVNRSESATVPNGETWVVYWSTRGTAKIDVNGAAVAGGGSGGSDQANGRAVLESGATISESSGNRAFSISGWKL